MKTHLVGYAALAACIFSATVAQASSINALHESPRVYDDFSTSTLTITNNYPTQAVIDDRNLTEDGIGGSWANRHDLELSSDGGATPHVFNIDDGFVLQAIFKMDVGSVSPRKEAGIRFNSTVTGDALFIVNSDAGEIVAFGGGAEFYSFSGGPQPDYVPGTEILLGVKYSGGTSSPRTLEYFIDRDPSTVGIGIESSGPLAWSNLENGPVDPTVGFYGQVSPIDDTDFMTITIDDIKFTPIPEPSSVVLSILAMCGLVGVVGRKKS